MYMHKKNLILISQFPDGFINIVYTFFPCLRFGGGIRYGIQFKGFLTNNGNDIGI